RNQASKFRTPRGYPRALSQARCPDNRQFLGGRWGAASLLRCAMSDAVRIAHVALQLETGGMERLLVDFARHADRRRFDLRFVALGSRGRLADEIEAAGCPVTA